MNSTGTTRAALCGLLTAVSLLLVGLTRDERPQVTPQLDQLDVARDSAIGMRSPMTTIARLRPSLRASYQFVVRQPSA
jgi:hypothetical protein